LTKPYDGNPLVIAGAGAGMVFCIEAADAALISKSSASFRSLSTSFFVAFAKEVASFTCDCASRNASFLSRASVANLAASFCQIIGRVSVKNCMRKNAAEL
jgi:putative hemolysin